MIQGWLPVNAHPGRAQHYTLQHCPTCPELIASQTYFFQCSSSTAKWDNFFSTIIMDITTDSILQAILMWALPKYRSHHHPFPHDSDSFPPHLIHPKYTTHIQEQTAIGWHQIIHGRWATQWAHYLNSTHQGKRESQAISLVTELWHATLIIWRDRCDIQHKNDNSADNNPTSTLQPIVEALYEQKDKLDVHDQCVLAQPRHVTLRLPQPLLKDWTRRTRDFVRLGLRVQIPESDLTT
jgi:hypothetical protein